MAQEHYVRLFGCEPIRALRVVVELAEALFQPRGLRGTILQWRVAARHCRWAADCDCYGNEEVMPARMQCLPLKATTDLPLAPGAVGRCGPELPTSKDKAKSGVLAKNGDKARVAGHHAKADETLDPRRQP
ncbi:hypothetical protein NKI88_15680 [Mesorhizobium sp. M0317]|uniref:hypothetical protein n=1 Tax=Mesorhizobium sp. M0317 TaxID=2956935 RepID=UPI003335910E